MELQNNQRELMVEKMIQKDIESITNSYLEYKDTGFLYSILYGSGFTQYSNLTDDQIWNEYNDRQNYWNEDEE